LLTTTSRRGRLAAIGLLFGIAIVTLVGLTGDASACGGFFCDGPPPDPFAPLPVAQAGENVVFSITPDPAGGAPTLVAHIQILYAGDAAKFSWVVPVDGMPDLSVGTDRLFSALAGVTQPRFQTNQLTDGTCIPPMYGGSGGLTGSGGAASSGSGGSSGAGGSAAGGVTVSFQGAVGPFDAAVITSGDAVALKMWLSDNGYAVSDAAGALIDAYVHEGKFFVALKLLNGVGVKSIQPIVLTFRGTEPCIPLRLTAIAANPDMPVLLWVLGDRRVVPEGYFEITLDEARIDWPSGGSNYFGPRGLVSQAADAAGGNAFITEYAGTSTVARAAVYANGQFDIATLQAAMTPPVYVQQVISMGLASDPLMLSLLATYIPMPDAVKAMGITDAQFYGSLSTYWAQYAFPAYDLAGLTADITAKIIQPRQDAQMMIDQHPYLTRLDTFISPEEMTKDPLFFQADGLPDVSNVHVATLRTMCGNRDFLQCNAPIRLELADGRIAWVRAGSKASTCTYAPYDLTHLATLSPLEVAWERDTVGDGTRVIDNNAMIDQGIAANNSNFPMEESMFPTGTSGTGGVPGTGGAGTGAVGGAASGGASGGATGGNIDGFGESASHGGGCSCSVGDGMGVGRLSLVVAAGALAMKRRKRRG
jgi:uncharacterized membrane protein YgcG